MRIAIAGFNFESVSFILQETTIDDFEKNAYRGEEIIEKLRGTNTVAGGFIGVCEHEGVDLTGIVSTSCLPVGPASDKAFEKYTAEISEGLQNLRNSIDGVLLHLHGAMTTPTRLDPDVDILKEIRSKVGPDFPVIVGLDLHANLDESILEYATAVFGYHCSPHIDMGKTGERAGYCMIRTLRGDIRPVCRFAKPKVIVPGISTVTELAPLSSIMAHARQLEKQAKTYIDISVFAGFPYADVPNCGFSVITVSDNDPELAKRTVEDLSNRIWELRHELYRAVSVYNVADGVALAIEMAKTAEKPIVLVEQADRMNDSTYVLRELLHQKAKNVACPYIWDPKAAAAALEAGEGSTISLQVGGHSHSRAGGPVTIEGKILYAGNKEYRITGPIKRGTLLRLGTTAVIDTGNIIISIISTHFSAMDEDPFVQFGFRVQDFDIILLRSKVHFRAVYEKLADEIIIIDTPDWGTAALTCLPYKHVLKKEYFPFTEY